MTGQQIGQVDSLVCSPLWHHNNATNLLHLRVVWWTGAIQVACNLEEPNRGRGHDSIEFKKILPTKLIQGIQPGTINPPFHIPVLADLRCK